MPVLTLHAITTHPRTKPLVDAIRGRDVTFVLDISDEGLITFQVRVNFGLVGEDAWCKLYLPHRADIEEARNRLERCLAFADGAVALRRARGLEGGTRS